MGLVLALSLLVVAQPSPLRLDGAGMFAPLTHQVHDAARYTDTTARFVTSPEGTRVAFVVAGVEHVAVPVPPVHPQCTSLPDEAYGFAVDAQTVVVLSHRLAVYQRMAECWYEHTVPAKATRVVVAEEAVRARPLQVALDGVDATLTGAVVVLDGDRLSFGLQGSTEPLTVELAQAAAFVPRASRFAPMMERGRRLAVDRLERGGAFAGFLVTLEDSADASAQRGFDFERRASWRVSLANGRVVATELTSRLHAQRGEGETYENVLVEVGRSETRDDGVTLSGSRVAKRTVRAGRHAFLETFDWYIERGRVTTRILPLAPPAGAEVKRLVTTGAPATVAIDDCELTLTAAELAIVCKAGSSRHYFDAPDSHTGKLGATVTVGPRALFIAVAGRLVPTGGNGGRRDVALELVADRHSGNAHVVKRSF